MPEQLVLYYKHSLSTDEAGKMGRSGSHSLLTHELTSTCGVKRGALERSTGRESDVEHSGTKSIKRKIWD